MEPDSERVAARGAVCGVLAPAFTLGDVARPVDAPPVRLRDLRQRRPALLALLPETGAERNVSWLHAITGRLDDLAYYGAAVFAVAPEAEARSLLAAVDITFPLLADVGGATLSAYLGADTTLPALAVVDRYNQLAALLRADSQVSAPDLDAALGELSFADQQDCACTLPAWEE